MRVRTVICTGSLLRTSAVTFDIDTYSRLGGRLDLAGLDLEAAFGRRPLDTDALRCLQYMHDIENHTVCYLRDVLVTRAHADPEVTTFLTIWNYEEHWHGEALGRVLVAHGADAGRDRTRQVRASRGRLDRLRPLGFIAASALAGDIVATQMAWGAINEWSTQAGYARLAARANHPTLTELLRRVMRQEGRHIDFYATQARRRLAHSAGARRLTRFALARLWGPVGGGVRPRAEVEFVVNYLFGPPDGNAAVERVDRCVDRLPGLAGLHLIRRARDRWLRQMSAVG